MPIWSELWPQIFLQFLKLIELKKKNSFSLQIFSVRKILAYATQKLIDSIFVTLGFRRIKQKVLCVRKKKKNL